jgi:hypothetical protein
LLLAGGLVLLASIGVTADQFERPPSFDAAKILGRSAQGADYRIVTPVRSDGYLRDYTIETAYGPMSAGGDQMLLMRIKEINALAALERTTGSKKFADALLKAGLSPVEFAGNLVTKPVETVRNTLTGVGKLFGSIASGVKGAGKSRDSAMASVTGVAKQRRLIAYEYGIDPYTDFKPLSDKLNELARAAAIGGLAVTAAFIAVPGTAGTIVSNVSTANTLSSMVRDYSAAQLADINRKKLGKMGVDPDVAEEFLQNKNYTPVDSTVIVDALTRMRGVRHRDIMIERAASVDNRDVAFFIRKRMELTAAFQETTGELVSFVRLGNSPFPLLVSRSKGIVGVFPIDILSWTEETAPVISAMTSAADGNGLTGPKVLRMSGSATPLAKKNLQRLGWKIEENAGG